MLLCHEEFPGDAIRILECYIALPEGLVHLRPRVLDAGAGERSRDALELRLFRAGEGDVIDPETVRAELVARGRLIGWRAEPEGGSAREEQHEPRQLGDHRKPEGLRVELFRTGQIADSQGDMVDASGLDVDRHRSPATVKTDR